MVSLSCDHRLVIKNAPYPKNDQETIAKTKYFSFANRYFLAIAKISGLVQLYERTCSGYQLHKEWKNSTTSPEDQVIGIGILNKQFLYTCSFDGKLILRDLVNDDDDQSYKVYMVHRQVVDIQLAQHGKRILVACAGRDIDLRVYEIDSDKEYVIEHSDIRSTLWTRRRSEGWQVTALYPVWSAKDTKEFSDHYHPEEVNNVVSVCFLGGGKVACGSQFGKILIFDVAQDRKLVSTQLSSFAINFVKKFTDLYLIYSDAVSHVGILDINSNKQILLFEGLEIGPVGAIKIVAPATYKSRMPLRFSPIYVLSTTIDKRMVVYKLFDDGEIEEKLNMRMFSKVAITLEIAGVKGYDLLHKLFGDATNYEEKTIRETDDLFEVRRKRKSFSVPLPVGDKQGPVKRKQTKKGQYQRHE